jgi:hypothetical protein
MTSQARTRYFPPHAHADDLFRRIKLSTPIPLGRFEIAKQQMKGMLKTAEKVDQIRNCEAPMRSQGGEDQMAVSDIVT